MTQANRKMSAAPETRPSVFPPWDAKGVAKVYLDALRQEAEAGPLDEQWLAGLLDHLVHALRSAYSPEDFERAVANLEPLLLAWEEYAANKHAALPPTSLRAIPEQALHRRERHSIGSKFWEDISIGARGLAMELPGAILELLSPAPTARPPRAPASEVPPTVKQGPFLAPGATSPKASAPAAMISRSRPVTGADEC
jgi:hypothetical protein